jgi:hypothetical protein
VELSAVLHFILYILVLDVVVPNGSILAIFAVLLSLFEPLFELPSTFTNISFLGI